MAKVVAPAPQSMSLVDESGASGSHHERELEASACHPVSCLFGALFFPITLFSCYTVQEREEVVLLHYGKYTDVVSTPGCHFSNMWGRDMRRLSTKVNSIDLPEVKVVDRNGNPLVISGVLTYQFRDTKRAVLDVENCHAFVGTQAQAALKQIVSRYPYESDDGHSLKTEARQIGEEMVSILQDRVNVAGAKIHSFAFNEISYAPEIAPGMLKRQLAAATVDARKVIVHGAVEIAHGAVHELEQRGIRMDAEGKAHLVTNLLTVITSDREPTPTIAM